MRVLFILTTLLLVGCASTGKNTQDKLNGYIGSSIDDFIIQVTPRSITNLTSGGKKYEFRTRETTLPYPIVCDYSLITNSRGVIIGTTKPRCW